MTRGWGRWRPASAYWRDVSWLASGAVAAQALNLLALPVLTRLYQPSAFGVLAAFTQVVAFLTLLVTLRYEYAVPLPRRRHEASAVMLLVAMLAAGGTLLWTVTAFLATPWLRQLNDEMPVGLWWLAPLAAGLAAWVLAQQHEVQRHQEYRRVGGAEVLTKAAYFVVAGVMALWWVSPVGLAVATVIASVARGLWLARGQQWPQRLRATWQRRRRWLALALRQRRRHSALSRSMLVSHLMMTGTGTLPTLYLGQVHGSGTLGQWALVVSTSYLPSALIGAAIGNVYFQRAAQAWGRGESIALLWRTTARRLAWIGVPVYALFALIAPWLYPLLFGSQWAQAGQFAAVMALSSGLAFLSTPLDRTCIVVGAWSYIPIWHALRLGTTALVLGASHYWSWPAATLVLFLTVQMSAMYLIDFAAERRFAMRLRAP